MVPAAAAVVVLIVCTLRWAQALIAGFGPGRREVWRR
jgi:hypothetical protein